MSWFEFSPIGALRAPLTGLMLAGLALGLTGCESLGQGTRRVANAITLYKSDVVQGNFVSREQVAQLHAGMTRLQVRDLLGTPLITPLFMGDRWDYVFTMTHQGVPQQSYRLTIYFTGDTLDHFDGDTMPSEDEFVQRISDDHKHKVKVPPLTATAEQLKAFAAANPPVAPASDASASAAAPDKTYPPLE